MKVLSAYESVIEGAFFFKIPNPGYLRISGG